MKKLVYVMSLVTMVLMMSLVCSCGNGSKNQENSIDESVASDSISDNNKETNVNEMNSTIPSVQEIGVLFTDMEKGKSSALKDYGFTLEDKQ